MSRISADKAALIEAAQVAGLRVTSKQIDRWRSEDLLPNPELQGRGRARGISRVSPEATVLQLIALAHILQENRSLDLAAFRLWVGGFNVPLERLRKALVNLIAMPFARFSKKTDDERADEIAHLESTLADRRTGSKRLKKSAQQGQLSKLMQLMSSYAIGRSPKTSEMEREDFAQTFVAVTGLDRARTETPTPEIEPWLKTNPKESMFELLALSSNFATVAKNATDEQLEKARQIFLALEQVRAWATYAKRVYGHAFGMEVLFDGLGITSAQSTVWLFGAALVLSVFEPDLTHKAEALGSTAREAVKKIEDAIAFNPSN